jgi:hypothetical protein
MAEPRNIFRDGPVKAHDVRNLRPCAHCGGIGDKRDMLNLDGWYHGICVVERFTHDEILALPGGERSKLRLCDTGPNLMRKLLDAYGAEASDGR